MLPIKLEKVGRTAIYGSWFNFYLCEFQGRVKLPGASTCPSATSRIGQVRPRMKRMIPFRERNPVVIGAISLALIAASLVVAFRAGDLPVIGGGDTYYAAFSEAGGLKANDEVRIAGVRVGKVDSVTSTATTSRSRSRSTPPRVRPRHQRRDQGQDPARRDVPPLEPAGGGQMKEESTIPIERTASPYDVVEAFEGLASTTEQIDTDQLAASLTTLADLTRNTPEEFRAALDGVTRLSANVAARDERDQHAAGQPREGLPGARRARQDIVGADAATPTCCSGRWWPAARRSTTC